MMFRRVYLHHSQKPNLSYVREWPTNFGDSYLVGWVTKDTVVSTLLIDGHTVPIVSDWLLLSVNNLPEKEN